MDVDHAADHFTPSLPQIPLMSGIIIYSEGHCEKEDEVSKDQVQHSDGGGGKCAGFHDVYHQAQANGTGEENHRVDDEKECVVLGIIWWIYSHHHSHHRTGSWR